MPPIWCASGPQRIRLVFMCPTAALPILEYADVAGAALLRCFCLAVAVANLDAALAEAPATLAALPRHLQVGTSSSTAHAQRIAY